MAQRKKFTRVEMARVLMERNQVRNFKFSLSSINDKQPTSPNSTKSVLWNCKKQFAGPK